LTINEDFDEWIDKHIESIKDFIATQEYTPEQRALLHGIRPEDINEHILQTAETIRDKWKELNKK
jgi:hypothetical protein